MAVECATAVNALANIATAVTPRLIVQQPRPPIAPAQALPEELMKAVTVATQQSFIASEFKLMTKVVGTVAPARRGSSPSAKRIQRRPRSRVREGAAENAAVPSAPPLVAEKPRTQGSGGKGLSHKEIPAAKTAPGGAAKIGNAPNAKIAEVTSVPNQPLAGARPPTGASANVPSADKDGRAGKGVAAANALKDQLRLLASHWAAQLPPPPVDARLAKTIARFEAPIIAVPSASVPRVAPAVAARTTADPKSALLRAQLGMRGSTAPTQQAAGSSATPTSGNHAAPTSVAADVKKAAEKGVRAALATGGGPVEEVALDADIADIQAHLDAAKPRTLSISGTAHVSPAGGSAERKMIADAVGEGNAKRKGKAGS
ncbi:unnamed protein product [Closterium sp. NIES-65]|nr:unnamed protein product [Closterium sp. NIES-65]